MSERDPRAALFEEETLGELLAVFESAFSHPLPAKALGGWSGVLSLIFLLVLWYLEALDVDGLQQACSMMASYALTVSSALMGVVIAGMSIFAASLKPKVASSLIETPYPGTNISSLKFIFSMFVYVLFALLLVIAACAGHYLILGGSSYMIKVLASPLGLGLDSSLYEILLSVYASIMIGLILFLGSLLKSFIWNLHQVLLVVAVFNGRAER